MAAAHLVALSSHDRYGGLPAWMAAAAVLALAALLSLCLTAALAASRVGAVGRPLADAALFARRWLLAELARGVLFTGFPWAASGYAHDRRAACGLGAVVGVYGMGALAAFVVTLAALRPDRTPAELAARHRAARGAGRWAVG